MVGRVAGNIVDAHSTNNSSNLESGVDYDTESATWGEEKATVSVLDIVKK